MWGNLFFFAPKYLRNEVKMDMKNNNPADELKDKLNTAISQAVKDFHDNSGEDSGFKYKRVLDLETMIKLLLSFTGGSLQKELVGVNATASAFVQQRKKMGTMIFEEVLHNFNSLCHDAKKYKEHRILAIDGTCVNIPRNPNAESFVQNASNPKGYNQLHVTPLFDVLNKTYYNCVIQPQPQQDEVGALSFMAQCYNVEEKIIIVADRMYGSYNAIAHMQANKDIKFIIRLRHGATAMRALHNLPMEELDTDVSFTLSTGTSKQDRANNYIQLNIPKNPRTNRKAGSRFDFPTPYTMGFRVVRFQLSSGEYETLATNLPREFTSEDLKYLYHERWGIETAFRDLKYSLGLVHLHGKSDEFAMQEIYSAMIIANFCSRIVNQIIVPQKESNIHSYAVNMKMAIQLCKEFYRYGNISGKKLIKEIAKYTEPIREGRADTRYLKAKSFVGFIYRVPT